ncbi:MAG: hypothetical protein QXU98_04140 [Candidatus Parvarchaeota archaeon]
MKINGNEYTLNENDVNRLANLVADLLGKTLQKSIIKHIITENQANKIIDLYAEEIKGLLENKKWHYEA